MNQGFVKPDEKSSTSAGEETPPTLLTGVPDVDADNEIIKLNVGGHKFTTTRATLQNVPGSFFDSMIRHNGPAARLDEEGNLFIERDGTHFQHILNYLLDGFVGTTLDSSTKTQLLHEAEYYGLDGLKLAFLQPTVNVREHLNDDILSIRDEEDDLRSKFSTHQSSGLDDHVGLIPLFCPERGVQPLPLTFQPHDMGSQTVMYGNRHLREARAGTPATVGSLEEFKNNFYQQHYGVSRHRFQKILQEERVIVAGGSVLRALTYGNGIRNSSCWDEKEIVDIDLFLYGYTREEAKQAAKRIVFALRDPEVTDSTSFVVVRGQGVINIHCMEHGRIGYHDCGQIILRLYDSPAEVLLGFDVDCCCLAYDGEDVWMSRRCRMALERGINVLNPLHSWPNKASYEVRLAKYERRGFAIAVPGLDEALIDLHRIGTTELHGLKGIARLLKIMIFNAWHEITMLATYVDNGGGAAIIPSTYLDRIDSRRYSQHNRWWDSDHGRHMLEKAREILGRMCDHTEDEDYRNMIRKVPFHFDLSEEDYDRAWEQIVDAGDNKPKGLPRRLEGAWLTEKRSREYMNADMDKDDLDNTYYSEAYEKV